MGGPYTGWVEGGARNLLGDRYAQPDHGYDPAFRSIVNPKFPGLEFGIEGLNRTLQSTPLPKYGETLNAVSKAASGIPGAFDRYGREIDTTEYAAGQRGFNPQYSDLTGGYADTAHGIGTRYDEATGQYTGGLGDLTKRDYEQQANFDKAQEDVYNRIAAQNQRAFSKYGMGTNSNAGLSSAGLSGLITSNSDAALRLNLAKQQRMDQVLANEERRLGAGFGAEQARAGFQLPLERDIYGRRTADVERAQATERELEELKLRTANMSLDAALRQVPALAAAAESVARAQNLPLDDILKRAQTTEGLIRLLQQANYTAVRGPDATIPGPEGYDFSGIPDRYGPGTGTVGGGRGREEGFKPGYGMGGFVPPTTQQRYDAYRQSPQYSNLVINEGHGVYDLPNRYTWGRTPAQQRQFEEVQRSYE